MQNRLFLAFLFAPIFSFSQTVLTPRQAVETALRQNLGLEIAKNELEAARLNDTRANAGMTPDVSLTAGDATALNFSNQKYSNGSEINKTASPSNSFNAGIGATWTLFDGHRMEATKARLSKMTELEQLQLQAAALDLTAQTLQIYWQIWRDRAQIESLDELLRSTEERRRLAATKLELGLASKSDLLQAEIDKNTYESQRLRQQNLVEQGKIALAELLGNEPNFAFDVVENMETSALPVLSEEALEVNPNLLLFRKQLEINQLEQTEIAATNKPRLAATGGYNFLRSDNPASFIVKNQSHGATVGLQFLMPIYDGGRVHSRLAVSKIEAKNIDLARQNLERQFEADLKTAFIEYDFQKKAVELETENLRLATENRSISMERLRLASTTTLEVRASELLFENAAARRNQAFFSMKMAEIRVAQLVGKF